MAISFRDPVRRVQHAANKVRSSGMLPFGPQIEYLPLGDNGAAIVHALRSEPIVLGEIVFRHTSHVQVHSCSGNLIAEALVRQPDKPKVSPALVVLRAMQKMCAEGRNLGYGPEYPAQANAYTSLEELLQARPELSVYDKPNEREFS